MTALRMVLPSRQTWPLVMTLAVCLLLFGIASARYEGFFSAGVAINLINDNAFLGIAALGLTLVILCGGIDLSVGSMIGCSGIVLAWLIENEQFSPWAAAAIVLAGGAVFGVLQGVVIHYFALAPFLVTLGGLFALRGFALLVSTESIAITHEQVIDLSIAGIPLGGEHSLPLAGAIFIALAVVLAIVARSTPFGRNTYAIGGNEQSAVLMGLPVGRTKVLIYGLCGFCAALAGVVYVIYTASGNATAATGLELDAIAAVVVGGTLLTGGSGFVAGTVIGTIVFGIIQTAIVFEGTLSSWWTKIFAAALLLAFIAMQKCIRVRI